MGRRKNTGFEDEPRAEQAWSESACFQNNAAQPICRSERRSRFFTLPFQRPATESSRQGIFYPGFIPLETLAEPGKTQQTRAQATQGGNQQTHGNDAVDNAHDQ